MATASLTSKGQLTLPISIRKKLRLHAGDQVIFIEREDGDVVIQAKKGNIMDAFGMFKHVGEPATIEQMNEAIANHAVERYLRASLSAQE